VNVAVAILAAVLAVNVLYVLWGYEKKTPTADDLTLEQAEAQLAGEFDAYAARIDALYGKGE
jgi:hypothetical protein